eukprot:scaffold4941_cov179-Ochromonas_danica.AAC.6
MARLAWKNGKEKWYDLVSYSLSWSCCLCHGWPAVDGDGLCACQTMREARQALAGTPYSTTATVLALGCATFQEGQNLAKRGETG